MGSSHFARLFCILGLLFGGGSLFAAEDAPIKSSAEALTAVVMDGQGAWDYRLDGSDRLWLAYYDQNRLLRLRGPDGKERLLVPEGRGQAPSGLALAALDKGVGVLWRDKFPAKGLYLLDSNQTAMQPLDLGGDTEPLARFRAASGAGDLLHLLWYGEKVGEPTGERHHLYYRNWNRRTQALSPIDLVMPGIYPVISTDASGGVMAYSWMMKDGEKRIVARYRPANDEQEAEAGGFGEEVMIADVPEIAPIFDAFRSGSRWFVVWLAQYGVDKRDFLLEGAHSDDNGKTWKRFGIEDLRGYDLASLQIAADDAGHILMAVSGRTRLDDANTKQDVYLVRSADRGDTWSSAERLRRINEGREAKRDQQASSLEGYQARNPSVAFGRQPGQVLVVWEDWRDIRSGLYASLSNDHGKTWALSNVPLPKEPGKNLGLRYEPNAVYPSDQGFKVIAEQATDDGFGAKQLVTLSVSAEDLANYAKSGQSSTPPEAKVQDEALRKRAEAFWQAMQAGDYTKTYSYQDPFFRARMPLHTYLSNMGRIKYNSAKVDSLRIDGPRAEVTTTIRASVPAFRMPTTGEMVSRPEREAAVNSVWLWLDGDWYREFRIESQDTVFSRY